MKSIINSLVVLYSFLGAIPVTHSTTLIDTGQPELGQYPGGLSVFDQQFLAGRIELTQASIITGIEAFMGDGGTGGTATIALYSNSTTDKWGLPIPDTNVSPYAQAITIADVNIPDFSLSWQGINGLNWNLDAGSYWIAFEVRPGQTYNGYFPSQGVVPNPLPDYAFWNETNIVWYNDTLSSSKWGLRVYGEPASPVPLPASAWLFLSGLAPLIAVARRRAKRIPS